MGKFDDEDKEEREKKEAELNEDHSAVKDFLESALAGKVQKVKMTDQLAESPAALVQSAYGMLPTMQRYMKAQNVASGGSDAGMMGSFNQAVLEVNPSHPIVQDLEQLVKADDSEDNTAARNSAVLLYDVAALTSGYEIEDSADFAKRILSLMSSKAGGQVQDAAVEDIVEKEVIEEQLSSEEEEEEEVTDGSVEAVSKEREEEDSAVVEVEAVSEEKEEQGSVAVEADVKEAETVTPEVSDKSED